MLAGRRSLSIRQQLASFSSRTAEYRVSSTEYLAETSLYLQIPPRVSLVFWLLLLEHEICTNYTAALPPLVDDKP